MTQINKIYEDLSEQKNEINLLQNNQAEKISKKNSDSNCLTWQQEIELIQNNIINTLEDDFEFSNDHQKNDKIVDSNTIIITNEPIPDKRIKCPNFKICENKGNSKGGDTHRTIQSCPHKNIENIKTSEETEEKNLENEILAKNLKDEISKLKKKLNEQNERNIELNNKIFFISSKKDEEFNENKNQVKILKISLNEEKRYVILFKKIFLL